MHEEDQGRKHDERREHAGRLVLRGRDAHQEPDAALRSDELARDRADHGERHSSFEARHDVRGGASQNDLPCEL